MTTELGETIGNVENKDDQCAVRRTFDLEVAEEGVGAEEIKGFVYNIIL